jgi:hypothetical protein
MTESCGFEPLSIGGGWMVDEALFRLLLDLEVQKAQRLRYSVSIVCFTMARSDAGDGEASVASSIAEGIARRLRGTDAVATWTQGLLFFLLVDAETTHLPSILRRLTTPLQTAFWSAGGSSYPGTAVRADEMLQQAFDLLTLARNEGGNRLYVAS